MVEPEEQLLAGLPPGDHNVLTGFDYLLPRLIP